MVAIDAYRDKSYHLKPGSGVIPTTLIRANSSRNYKINEEFFFLDTGENTCQIVTSI